MTLDPKRLERIWAKCPELRPECISVGARGWCVDLAHVRDDVAAALIRDKCVWWMKDRDLDLFESMFAHPDPTEGCLRSVEAELGLT